MSYQKLPILYLAVGYLTGLLLLLYWLKYNSSPKIKYLSILVIIFLLWLRYPFIVFNQELNPDESQMIAHAMTLKSDKIYWEFVDGHTTGPLNSYILILPTFLGLAFDYTSARLVAFFLMLGSLFFFYKSLRQLANPPTAWLGILPLIFFLGTTQDDDFTHYSSEQLSVFLLNLSLWTYLRLVKSTQRNYYTWILLGFTLGTIPFCKLQAVPIALVIGLFSLLLARKHIFYKQSIAYLVAGGILFPFISFIWLFYHNLLEDFWIFYIQGNLVYGNKIESTEKILNFLTLPQHVPSFTLLLVSVFPLFITRSRSTSIHSKLAISMLLAAAFSVGKTGYPFPHYLHLFLYPLVFFAFVIGQKMLNLKSKLWIIWTVTVWIIGNVVYRKVSPQVGIPYTYLTSQKNVKPGPVSRFILQHANPTDRMSIWGWSCKYHVETQLAQGTTESHPERCIFESAIREKYYERYLNDIAHKKPRFFVDAVTPVSFLMNDRDKHSHDKFPELKRLIELHYSLIGEVDNVKIFIRKQ